MTAQLLAEHGYCVLRNVLSEDEILGLRAALEETLERVARALRTPYAASHPDAPLEERFDRIAEEDRSYSTALYQAVMADTHRDPRVAALISHPKLKVQTAELIAPLERTGEVIRPRAAIPAYQSRMTPWHQDVTDPRDLREELGSVRIACWIPLGDVRKDEGALEIASGHWEKPLAHLRDSDGHVAIPDGDLPQSGRVAPELRSGDVLVLDRYVPHRTGPVAEDKARWAFTMWVKARVRA